ncbi:hypothetical protein, partial [Sulfitobacter sp.]|uniref:hypothetical protein n=1 Tax=Sulfitobacter sp. TaxID=1903071 RepID=UPI0030018352
MNSYGFYFIPGTYRKREVSQTLLKGEVNEPRTLSLIQQSSIITVVSLAVLHKLIQLASSKADIGGHCSEGQLSAAISTGRRNTLVFSQRWSD